MALSIASKSFLSRTPMLLIILLLSRVRLWSALIFESLGKLAVNFTSFIFIPSLQVGGLKFAGQSDTLFCRGSIPFFKPLFQFAFFNLRRLAIARVDEDDREIARLGPFRFQPTEVRLDTLRLHADMRDKDAPFQEPLPIEEVEHFRKPFPDLHQDDRPALGEGPPDVGQIVRRGADRHRLPHRPPRKIPPAGGAARG